MAAIWELPMLPTDKLVMLALADCANDEGWCWPSIATVAAKSGVCERSVQRAIRRAEETKLIARRDEVLGKGCKYLLDPRHTVTPDTASPATHSRKTPDTQSPKPLGTVKSTVANATGAGADPVKELFDAGVALLVASGRTDRQARSLIGKWRKSRTDGDVMTGLIECRARAITEPVEWLEKRFNGAKHVSASGYEYRGDQHAILREAERRADWNTYWTVKGEINGAAEISS
jgi:Helix-turn-helix domain